MHLLKVNFPAFQVMSGPMARQRFEHGIPYQTVPEGFEHCFEQTGIPVERDPVEPPEEPETVEPEDTQEPEQEE